MASKVIQAFLSQYIPETFRAQILSEIDSTGDVSAETLKKAGISKKSSVDFIRGQIKEFAPTPELGGLRQRQLEDVLGIHGRGDIRVDEAGLTDEGLETRREIFEQLGKTGVPLNQRRSDIRDEFKSKLRAYGLLPARADQMAEVLADFTLEKGRYPTSQEFISKFPAGARAPLVNFFNDQNARNEFEGTIDRLTKAPDTFDDISRIEDLLKTRRGKAAEEKQLSEFIDKTLPEELAQGRGERTALLRELGDREFDAIAPQLLARENAMGRGSSGAVGDVLTGAYGDIQGRIESEVANMRSSDEEFHFNAAYQNQIRKLMEGQGNLAGSLAMERQNVRTGQQQRFAQGQFDLNQNLENDLLMQKYENQIRSAQTMSKRQQEMMKRQRRAGLVGRIGQVGAALGYGLGALFAAPTGGLSMMAGASLGSAIGGGAGIGLPMLFGAQR